MWVPPGKDEIKPAKNHKRPSDLIQKEMRPPKKPRVNQNIPQPPPEHRQIARTPIRELIVIDQSNDEDDIYVSERSDNGVRSNQNNVCFITFKFRDCNKMTVPYCRVIPLSLLTQLRLPLYQSHHQLPWLSLHLPRLNEHPP